MEVDFWKVTDISSLVSFGYWVFCASSGSGIMLCNVGETQVKDMRNKEKF